MDRFDVCHPITAAWEGGWSDHPDDPGGATMYGVTQAVYDAARKRWNKPERSVRKITMAEALRIYREEYWAPTAGKFNLFPGVDLATYDAAVNSGVLRAVTWLKASTGSTNHSETVRRICRKRLGFMQSLKIWKTFGKGWTNRVTDIEVKGVKMALDAMGVALSSKTIILAGERDQAAKDEKKAAANAGATGTVGAASGVGAASPDTVTQSAPVDVSALDPYAGWLLGAICVVAVFGLVYFIVQARAAKARKAAYAAATGVQAL